MKAFVFILLMFCGFLGFGQSLFESSFTRTDDEKKPNENSKFSGYVRAWAYGLGETYDYSYLFSEFCLKNEFKTGNVSLKSDIRLRTGYAFNEQKTQIELKEVFVSYNLTNFDIYLGNQIIMWGRTDGFNPTNNINPTNYFFLSGDPDDQILSNFLIRTKYRFNNNIDIDFIGIPFYMPSEYRFDLFEIGDFSTFASFDEIVLPERVFKNSSFAGRLNFEYPAIGFSLSYFNGHDPFTAFNSQGLTWNGLTPSVILAAQSYHKQSLGLDLALPVKTWIIRAEAAYNHTVNYSENIHIPNPNIKYVAGIDKRFFDLQLIAQYVGTYSFNWRNPQPPQMPISVNPADWITYAENMMLHEMGLFTRKIFNQQKRTNHAFMISLAKSFAYETINAELTGFYNTTSKEKLFRGKVAWRASDNISISAGGVFMNGPPESLFEYSGKVLGGAFLEFKAGF